MCILDEPECDPIHCPRAKGHFDRINAAVYEDADGMRFHQEREVLRQAEKWNVCPHELQFDVASWVDGVICDYNYAFDPTSKLKRFFAEGTKGDYIFLIDGGAQPGRAGPRYVQCHARQRGDFKGPPAPSARMHRAKAREGAEPLQSPDARLQRECDSCTELESVSTFLMMVNQLLEELAGWLEAHKTSEIRKQVLEFYFNLQKFFRDFTI